MVEACNPRTWEGGGRGIKEFEVILVVSLRLACAKLDPVLKQNKNYNLFIFTMLGIESRISGRLGSLSPLSHTPAFSSLFLFLNIGEKF